MYRYILVVLCSYIDGCVIWFCCRVHLCCKIINFRGLHECRLIHPLIMLVQLRIILHLRLKLRQHRRWACIFISHAGSLEELFPTWEFPVQFLQTYQAFRHVRIPPSPSLSLSHTHTREVFLRIAKSFFSFLVFSGCTICMWQVWCE